MSNFLMTTTSKFKVWSGYAISFVAFLVAFYQVDWAQLWESVLNLNSFYFFWGCVFTQLEMICGAWRWGGLIKPVKNVNLSVTYRYFMIGYLFNQILPARPGEIIRSVLFARKNNLSKISILSLSVLEKAADVCCLTVFMAFLAIKMDVPSVIYWTGMISGGAAGFLVLIIFYFVRKKNVNKFSLPFIFRFLPMKLHTFCQQLFCKSIAGMVALESINSIIFLTGSTVLIWIFGVIVTQCFLMAFGLNLPWHVSIFVLVVTNLGMMVPSSPGAIGVAHLLYIIALAPFGVDKTTALAVGVVIHGTAYLQIILIGVGSLWKEKIGFSESKSAIT